MIEAVPQSPINHTTAKWLDVLTYNQEHSCRVKLGGPFFTYKAAVAFIKERFSIVDAKLKLNLSKQEA